MREVDKAVLVGDVHLGWEETNAKKFRQFINEKIPEINPDVFILNGDIAELWRESYNRILFDYSDVYHQLNEIHNSGIDIIPIVGNHDWRFIETAQELATVIEEPWSFKEEYKFKSGEEKFVAVHGNQTDPFNRSKIQNSLLCMTGDDVGELMAKSYSGVVKGSGAMKAFRNRPLTSTGEPLVASTLPVLPRPTLRGISHVADPGALSKDANSGRKERTVKALNALYEETVLGSHTHVMEERDGYYNPGSWDKETPGYIVVDNGEVEIETYW